jgi:hypothetical protein
MFNQSNLYLKHPTLNFQTLKLLNIRTAGGRGPQEGAAASLRGGATGGGGRGKLHCVRCNVCVYICVRCVCMNEHMYVGVHIYTYGHTDTLTHKSFDRGGCGGRRAR